MGTESNYYKEIIGKLEDGTVALYRKDDRNIPPEKDPPMWNHAREYAEETYKKFDELNTFISKNHSL